MGSRPGVVKCASLKCNKDATNGKWCSATCAPFASLSFREERPLTHYTQYEASDIPEETIPISKNLVSRRVAAEVLGVSTFALYHWTRAGKIPAVRSGRTFVYSVKSVRKAMERNNLKGRAKRHVKKAA